jgi:hypothetical protein
VTPPRTRKAAKPRQRKRPRAETLGSNFDKNIAHLRRLRPAPVAKAIADDLVREQEGLRAQLAANPPRVMAMLDVLSHALDRVNDLWTIENRLFHMVNHQKEQAEARIAELEQGAISHSVDTAQVIADLEARIARLTAEKSALDADCEKIRGERDRALLYINENLPMGAEPRRAVVAGSYRPARSVQNDASAEMPTAPKPKLPWYRRSFTELLTRRGGA